MDENQQRSANMNQWNSNTWPCDICGVLQSHAIIVILRNMNSTLDILWRVHVFKVKPIYWSIIPLASRVTIVDWVDLRVSSASWFNCIKVSRIVWLGCLARLAVVSDTRRHSLVFVPSGNNWFSRRDGPIAVYTFSCSMKRWVETYRSLNARTSCINALTFSNGGGQFLASGGDGGCLVNYIIERPRFLLTLLQISRFSYGIRRMYRNRRWP